MSFKSDIEIAKETNMFPISEIASKLDIHPEDVEFYGKYKAKLPYNIIDKLHNKNNGKLVLVTAISPTPAGEGKTTTTVGLGDAMNRIGKKTTIAIREPSLGPVFGVKGGAAGGGYAQVVPMEDINLHFTGDFHAIGAANNLLAALIDNHIHHGNKLNIDVRNITWKRCVDMNDRQLRYIIDGLHGKGNGIPREDGYDITVASEIMAILCLSSDIQDMKERIKKIIIGYNYSGEPVTAGELNAHGAMTALLKDAINPNLVQTLEHTPAFVHGGPFANIAHGCNSVVATKLALKLSDYVITEAGFGADLGAEKFLDIKCRLANLNPSAVVIVATVRALKMHGGVQKSDLATENIEALQKGLPNLIKHIENITNIFGLPAVVAINKFPTDTDNELKEVENQCKKYGVSVVLSEVWEKGGAGGEALAKEVVRISETKTPSLQFAYNLDSSIEEKIESVVKKIYGGNGIDISISAKKQIEKINSLGLNNLPICIAKTQYSFSDNPNLLGRPENFIVSIKNVKVSAGAGFIVVMTGEILTMPGLPKVPAAEQIDVDSNGEIIGLF